MCLIKGFTEILTYVTKVNLVNSQSIMAWAAKEVVPDVVDEAPLEALTVKYPDISINEGNIAKPTQVKNPPVVSWTVEANTLYTICMTDPDAPCRRKPSAREWHHWLVVNIPGNNIEKGEVISEYVGAGPPRGTGLHRYVILVFKQPGKISPKERKLTNRQGQGRGKFSIRKFAEKYNLGKPVAGNFFEAEFDEYVPKLHQQLGF